MDYCNKVAIQNSTSWADQIEVKPIPKTIEPIVKLQVGLAWND